MDGETRKLTESGEKRADGVAAFRAGARGDAEYTPRNPGEGSSRGILPWERGSEGGVSGQINVRRSVTRPSLGRVLVSGGRVFHKNLNRHLGLRGRGGLGKNNTERRRSYMGLDASRLASEMVLRESRRKEVLSSVRMSPDILVNEVFRKGKKGEKLRGSKPRRCTPG